MAKVTFTDAAVAEKYESASDIDKQVRVITKNWQGNLSTIPMEIADELFAQEATDLIKLKATAKAGKEKAQQV